MTDGHGGSTATSAEEPGTDEPGTDEPGTEPGTHEPAAEERLEESLARPEATRPGWRGGRRSMLRNPALAWAVAVVALAAAVFFGLQARDLRAQEAAQAEALQAAEVAALQLTTFTGEGIDEWVEQTKTLAIGKFAEDVARQYDQKLREDLRQFQVQSVGEMINSHVQSMEGDEALVFTVLRQTTQYPTFEQTIEDEVRFEITVQRVDDRWMVSDAKLLSPTPAGRPRPFLDEQPAGG